MFRPRTALAWKNLSHDRRRLAVAAGGIGFAVLLMFMELGFLNALLNSTVQVLRKLNADLVIASRAKYSLPVQERFPIDRIYQARGLDGVDAYPVYMERMNAVLRRPGERGYPIRVLAFEPGSNVFAFPELPQLADELARPRTALADSLSRAKFGFPDDAARLGHYRAELAGRELTLAGTFTLGTDFANQGNLLMTTANFADYFRLRAVDGDPLAMVDLGVVRLAGPAELRDVQRTLADRLPGDVEIFTRDEFVRREVQFWRDNTPVGYIFLVGAAMGFVVGVIICYQIMYSDITRHMSEFATLKAIGYSNAYFVRVVLEQAVCLSVLGFIPGAIVSALLYRILAQWTGLLMVFDVQTSLLVLLSTLAMCIISGLLVLRKLLSADPASLY